MRTEIALKISGGLNELKGVRDAVHSFLESAKRMEMTNETNTDLDSIQQNRIILAIDEAVANIIEHGFTSPSELAGAQISLIMRRDPASLEFEIRDNGIPFNPLEQKPDTEFYFEEGLEDGVGLVALSTLDATYQRDNDQNILKLRRAWGKKA